MSYPLTGAKVKAEYSEIDEIEVKCWLPDYKQYGFLQNDGITFNDLHNKTVLTITQVDNDTGYIALRK